MGKLFDWMAGFGCSRGKWVLMKSEEMSQCNGTDECFDQNNIFEVYKC